MKEPSAMALSDVAPKSTEELASLSLDTAVEIEFLKDNADTSLEMKGPAGRLIYLLHNMSELARDPKSSHGIADPVTIAVFNQAVHAIDHGKLDTLDELFHEIRELALKFLDDKRAHSKSELSQFQEFCLALHRGLVSEMVSDDYEHGSEVHEGRETIGIY